MANFREVNEDDILKEWLDFREETLLCQLSDEDYKHSLNFDKFLRRFCIMFLRIINSFYRVSWYISEYINNASSKVSARIISPCNFIIPFWYSSITGLIL